MIGAFDFHQSIELFLLFFTIFFLFFFFALFQAKAKIAVISKSSDVTMLQTYEKIILIFVPDNENTIFDNKVK